MLNLSTVELNKLIDVVLAKRQWTQSRLAQELNTGPETISRWRAGSGIHRGHHDELLRLSKDDEATIIESVRQQLKIPFHVVIPRSSINVTLDKNGDFDIQGVMLAMLDKKES